MKVDVEQENLQVLMNLLAEARMRRTCSAHG